jgi:hypothetical protein
VEDVLGFASALAATAGAATSDAVNVAGTAGELVKRRMQGAFGVYTTAEGLVKGQVRAEGGWLGVGGLRGRSARCLAGAAACGAVRSKPLPHHLAPGSHPNAPPSPPPPQVDTMIASKIDVFTGLVNTAIAGLESLKAGKGPIKTQGIELTEVRGRTGRGGGCQGA